MNGRMSTGAQDTSWSEDREEPLPTIRISPLSRWVWQPIFCGGIVFAALAAGVASVFVNSRYTVRVILGLPLLVFFLGYPYALLLAWAVIEVFVASTFTIFSGNNLNTALTLPLLLVVCTMPIVQTLRRMPALALLFVFLLWVLAGIGSSPLDRGTFLTTWTLELDYVAVGILSINVLTTRRRTLGLIDSMLAVSTFIALYGIYGYVTHQNGDLDPTTGAFRSGSIFGIATDFALYLSLMLPLAIYRALTLRGPRRLGAVLLCVIFLIAVGLTFTRAAFLSVAVSVITIAFALRSRRMKISMLGGMLAIGIVLVLLATVGGVPIFDRFFGTDLTTLNGRTVLWNAIWQHFDPTQLFGHGLSASNALLTTLHLGMNGVTSIGLIGTSPHSLILGTLYDNGIIGLILLTSTFLALLVGLIKALENAPEDHRTLLAVILGACIAGIIQSLDSSDLLIPALGTGFWIIMALPFARYWSAPEPIEAKGDQDNLLV